LGLREWRGESHLVLVFMIMPLFGLVLFALLWRHHRRNGRTRSAALRGRDAANEDE
jgi:hypothetical protein